MKQKAAGGLLTWINCSLNRLNNSKRKKKLKKTKRTWTEQYSLCATNPYVKKKKIGEMKASYFFYRAGAFLPY